MVIYRDVLVEFLAYFHISNRFWQNEQNGSLQKGRSSPAEMKLWLRLGYMRNIGRTLPKTHLIGSDYTAVAAGFVQHPARSLQTRQHGYQERGGTRHLHVDTHHPIYAPLEAVSHTASCTPPLRDKSGSMLAYIGRRDGGSDAKRCECSQRDRPNSSRWRR